MKKILVFLLAGMLSAGVLAGCTFETGESSGNPSVTEGVIASGENAGTGGQNGGTVTTPDEPEQPDEQDNTENAETAPSEDTSPEETVDPPETVSETPQIAVDKKDYPDDFVGEFPQIVGVQNGAADAINQEIRSRQTDFENAVESHEEHTWIECRSYSEANSDYLNLIIVWNRYPVYGYKGTMYSYIYDIRNQKEISFDQALELTQTQSPDIRTAFENFLKSNEESAYRQIDSFSICGVNLGDDGNASVYFTAETSDSPETPQERATTASTDIYTYYTANGEIVYGVH